LVPKSFFLYAEKKMSPLERIIRKLAGNVDLSAIPCSYPYPQLGLSFIQVVSKGYGAHVISKVMDGLVQRTVYQLKYSR